MTALALKICTACDKSLPLDDFHREKRSATGYQRWCRDCSNNYRRDVYAARPAVRQRSKEARQRQYVKNPQHVIQRTRKNEMLKKYGLSWEQYQALLLLQNNRCALCETDEPRGQGSWHIDHNHDTGEVRGLLCHPCNTSLGVWEKLMKQFGIEKIARYIANAAVAKHPSKKRKG